MSHDHKIFRTKTYVGGDGDEVRSPSCFWKRLLMERLMLLIVIGVKEDDILRERLIVFQRLLLGPVPTFQEAWAGGKPDSLEIPAGI